MEYLDKIIYICKFIEQYWDNFVKLYLISVGISSVIVKLTPTLKDNNFLLKTIKFIGKYIALNRDSSKDDKKRAANV